MHLVRGRTLQESHDLLRSENETLKRKYSEMVVLLCEMQQQNEEMKKVIQEIRMALR